MLTFDIYTLKKFSFVHIKEIFIKKNSNSGFFRESINIQIYLIENLKEEWKKDESNVNDRLFLYHKRCLAIIVLLGNFRIKTLFPSLFFSSPSSLYSLFKMRVMWTMHFSYTLP
jgi:hypothetical protein